VNHVFERKAGRVHDSLTALATTDTSPDELLE